MCEERKIPIRDHTNSENGGRADNTEKDTLNGERLTQLGEFLLASVEDVVGEWDLPSIVLR